jgi:adenylate cyclase class 2
VTLMLEREVKLRFASPEDARTAIMNAGATPLRCRRLQEDALLDTEDESLRRQGCVLRIRTENGKSLLTFKGPVQPGTMKVRDEHETVVGDGAVLQHVLEQLGLHVWFRYEKYREEYAAEDVTIALDETPVGTFVEIEGSEQGIRTMTERLGRSASEFILDSYRSLFVKHRHASGSAGEHMVFTAE